MDIKDQFINKMEMLNSIAKRHNCNNFKDWAKRQCDLKKINLVQYEEIDIFNDIRNIIAHGAAGRVIVYQSDIDKLNRFLILINKFYGYEIDEKDLEFNEEPVVKKIGTKKPEPKVAIEPKKKINYDGPAISLSVKEFRKGFETYFVNKKPDYKYPGPLYGMAFYITKHNIGVTLEDMFSGKVSLDEYGDILLNEFSNMNSTNPYARMSAYKDAMKNLLEYVHDMNYENIKIEK